MVTLITTMFKIKKFYVLRTQCIYVFCVDLRTNNDYFPIQHKLSVFYNRGVCLLRGTDWIFIYTYMYTNPNYMKFRSVLQVFKW